MAHQSSTTKPPSEPTHNRRLSRAATPPSSRHAPRGRGPELVSRVRPARAGSPALRFASPPRLSRGVDGDCATPPPPHLLRTGALRSLHDGGPRRAARPKVSGAPSAWRWDGGAACPRPYPPSAVEIPGHTIFFCYRGGRAGGNLRPGSKSRRRPLTASARQWPGASERSDPEASGGGWSPGDAERDGCGCGCGRGGVAISRTPSSSVRAAPGSPYLCPLSTTPRPAR